MKVTKKVALKNATPAQILEKILSEKWTLQPEDKDMIEDLVAAAYNAAVRRAEEVSQEKMGKIAGGMPGLPGGMKFPF